MGVRLQGTNKAGLLMKADEVGSSTQELLVTMTTAEASVSFHIKSEGFRVNWRGGGGAGLQQEATWSQNSLPYRL